MGKIEGYELDNELAKKAVRRFLERWRKTINSVSNPLKKSILLINPPTRKSLFTTPLNIELLSSVSGRLSTFMTQLILI